MPTVRTLRPLLVWMTLGATALALLVAGCGAEDTAAPPEPPAAEPPPATAPDTTAEEPDTTAEEPDPVELAHRPAGIEGLRVPAERAQIVVEDSAFGRVLFDANGQVVYAFENDSRDQTACTSEECVKAWPPVLTREQPSAGNGVDERLLGTIRRSDGALQVTYNGRPLYFYEHEAPGEIRCHNVDLHGGLWWVVTPAGDPAA
jgi:predicted lipoprotein with Yx(FWY)xxD motif